MIDPRSWIPACLLAAALAAQAPPETIRLGAWNLEFLGFREPRRSDADFAEIATYVRRLGVDVLAVEEVGGPEPLGRLVGYLGEGWESVLGTTGRFRDGTGQLAVGFVWNDRRVELLQAEELMELPREADSERFGRLPIFHRVPVCAVFRVRGGGLDFRAVVVHLKASRGAQNEAKRVLEMTHLGRWLKALLAGTGEDQDVVVLGDFNHTYGAPAHRAFMQSAGQGRYLRPERLSPTIIHFDEPIDHIAPLAGLDEEVLEATLTVHGADALRDRDGWRATYSDHVPVTVDLRARPDGDPEAVFRAADPRFALGGGPAEVPRAPGDGAAPAPFAPGSRVTLYLADRQRVLSGVLLAPPGDWVFVEVDGVRVGYPRENIDRIEGR